MAILFSTGCSKPPELHELLSIEPIENSVEAIHWLADWKQTQPPVRFYQHLPLKDPVTRARLYETEGLLVRDNPPIKAQEQTDWGSNPNNDSNWLFQKNATYVLAPFIQSYELTGEERYLAAVTGTILDWIEYHRSNTHPFHWYDMATGLRAVNLAFAIEHELRRKTIEIENLQQLLLSSHEHLLELADPDKLAVGNHAYFQLVGIVAICTAIPQFHDCPKFERYAHEKFEHLVLSQFSAEGIHREHAPGYHEFALKRTQRILASNTFSISEDTTQRVDKAQQNRVWFYHPDGSLAMIGDTDRDKRPRSKLLSARSTKFGLAGYQFPNSGWGFLRNATKPEKESYLVFWAGEETNTEGLPHSYGHSHYDNFTFEWSEGTQQIIIDSGKWGYEIDDWRSYVQSARAHNTIEIEGMRDYPDAGIDGLREFEKRFPKIREFQANAEGLQYLKATQNFMINHQRSLVLNPGKWLVVVDQLRDSEVRKFNQWFHLHEVWDFQPQSNSFYTTTGSDVLEVVDLTDNAMVAAIKGQIEPEIQGWVSPSYLEKYPNIAIGLSKTGSVIEFATLFLLNSELPIDDVSFESDGSDLTACWGNSNVSEGFQVVRTEPRELTSCF